MLRPLSRFGWYSTATTMAFTNRRLNDIRSSTKKCFGLVISALSLISSFMTKASFFLSTFFPQTRPQQQQPPSYVTTRHVTCLYPFLPSQAAAPRPQSLRKTGPPVTFINGNLYDNSWRGLTPASPTMMRPSFKRRGRPVTSQMWRTDPSGLCIEPYQKRTSGTTSSPAAPRVWMKMFEKHLSWIGSVRKDQGPFFPGTAAADVSLKH